MSFFDKREPLVIAMIHVDALPGTPRSREPLPQIIASAVAEARILAAAGVDGMIIENMHDLPYLNGGVGPEIVAALTAIGGAVRGAAPDLPVGVQVLAGAGRESLAIAHALGAPFIRVENFVFAHVADEGLMHVAAAGPLLRYRRQIGAEAIQVWADVKKKHASHSLTADISVAEAAAAAEFSGANAVIITGGATGKPAEVADLRAVSAAVKIPVIAGSGVTVENIEAIAPFVNAVIVGTALKFDAVWSNAVDPERVTRFVGVARRLRARPA